MLAMFYDDEGDPEIDDDLNSYDPDDYCECPVDFTDTERRNNGSGMLSLQDICLTSIRKNLPRFNLAFSSTEDCILQRNLHFLQRVHSSYLIKAATKNDGKLEESYFDFLLNQYIKKFNMEVLFRCNWDIVLKRMSEIGHGFQDVCLNFPKMYPPTFEKVADFVNKVVCHLPNVEILDLNPYCTDSTLEIIASSCLQLKELCIDDCSVTDEGLKSLCQGKDGNVSCLNLKRLSLPGKFGACSNDGIAYLLQNMPSLEVIVYPDLPYVLHKMHKDSMNNTLDRKYNLTSLLLENNTPLEDTPTISDIVTLYSEVCPHIKDLSLPISSKEHLDLCFKFPELEDFSVNVNGNLILDLNEFLRFKGGILRKLFVEDFTLSVAVLLQNCPQLESLTLQNIKFQSSEPGTVFQPLNNLQELSLGFFNLDNTLIQESLNDILNSSQKIEKLSLRHFQFKNTEQFVTRLSKFCENDALVYLRFSYCDVDDVFLQSVLLTCSNLKTLEIDSCYNITPEHMDNFNEILKSLKSNLKMGWWDNRSEFGSLDSAEDFYDEYSGFDSEDYDDPYDSDNLYYGYDPY